jgi:hypothetical protein
MARVEPPSLTMMQLSSPAITAPICWISSLAVPTSATVVPIGHKVKASNSVVDRQLFSRVRPAFLVLFTTASNAESDWKEPGSANADPHYE